MSLITQIANDTANAAKMLAILDEATKNKVLAAMAAAIRDNQDEIVKVNTKEVAEGKQAGLDDAMLDRLTLTPARIEDMAAGIETIIELADPVGQERSIMERPNGLQINKMRVPLGVVCMIYEARPNVTADAGALCFKSGNGVILRGGKEALQTSMAIAGLLQQVLREHDLPEALISVIPDPDRALIRN